MATRGLPCRFSMPSCAELCRLTTDQRNSGWSHVRTLLHHASTGSHPADLSDLWRAAKLAALLQCRSDNFASPRAPGAGTPRTCVDAMGLDPMVLEGRQAIVFDNQRPRRRCPDRSVIPRAL